MEPVALFLTIQSNSGTPGMTPRTRCKNSTGLTWIACAVWSQLLQRTLTGLYLSTDLTRRYQRQLLVLHKLWSALLEKMPASITSTQTLQSVRSCARVSASETRCPAQVCQVLRTFTLVVIWTDYLARYRVFCAANSVSPDKEAKAFLTNQCNMIYGQISDRGKQQHQPTKTNDIPWRPSFSSEWTEQPPDNHHTGKIPYLAQH